MTLTWSERLEAKGMEKGLAEGMEKGLAKGLQKGKRQGLPIPINPAVSTVVEGYAALAATRGEPARGAELLGLAHTLRGFPDKSSFEVVRTTAAVNASMMPWTRAAVRSWVEPGNTGDTHTSRPDASAITCALTPW